MGREDGIAIYEGGVPDLFVARDPVVVIKEARQAAQVLVDVVSQKRNKVMMGGEQYLEFEDWQTVAKFYGCTAKVRSTEFIDLGGVKGFLAIADCLDRNGNVLSSAEAMCLNDEEKWSTRTKYRYEDEVDDKGKKIWVAPAAGKKGYYKSVKIPDGEVSVPLFQLRSMAQTRACAKSLRNVFSWVVVLGGYKPTVAEELEDGQVEREENKPPIKTPQPRSSTTPGVGGAEKGASPASQEAPGSTQNGGAGSPPSSGGDPGKGGAAAQGAGEVLDAPKTDAEKKAFVLAIAERGAKQFNVSVSQVIFDLSKFKDKDDPTKEVGVQGVDDPRLVGRWLNKVYGEAKRLEAELEKPF